MRVPELNRPAILLVASLFFQSVHAQITAEDRNAAIQNIAKQIAANYIHPEKGGQIASHIQTANFKGQFNKATSWKEFDEMVTNELKKFSEDEHLYVRHAPEIVKELKNIADTDKSNITGTSSAQNSIISEAKVLPENIGYIKIEEMSIHKNNLPELNKAMRAMEGTKALIIDLRDNGGGGSDAGLVLESYFFPEAFPLLQFTDREGNTTVDSTIIGLRGKKYDNPVYIIVNNKTASAAEAFAFVLQQNGRAKIIGERTAGAAYKNTWYAVDDENFVSVSTAVPSLPGKNISWEQTGLQPDIKVKKADPMQIAVKEASKA